MAQKSRRAALGGEALRYLLFGVLTTALNMALYALFQALFGYAAANSWGNVLDNILCILFAYATNRRFVFASRTRGRAAAAEFGRFVTCRLGTMALDAAAAQALWGFGVKAFANLLVIVLNYLFSKLLIFRQRTEQSK